MDKQIPLLFYLFDMFLDHMYLKNHYPYMRNYFFP